jgi:hypothetical protein
MRQLTRLRRRASGHNSGGTVGALQRQYIDWTVIARCLVGIEVNDADQDAHSIYDVTTTLAMSPVCIGRPSVLAPVATWTLSCPPPPPR